MIPIGTSDTSGQAYFQGDPLVQFGGARPTLLSEFPCFRGSFSLVLRSHCFSAW